MVRRGAERWRSTVKAALASTISRAHQRGFASALARGTDRPLVVGYHRVVDDFEAVARTEMPSMLTGRAMFERHLDCIGRHFRFVSLDEIGARLATRRPFAEPVAAITFDDGYRDIYEHAYPILRSKGIPAAVFVVTELVGRPFWQVHDKLYHLVAKAFASWSHPRQELIRLLNSLDVPSELITNVPGAARDPQMAVSALLPELTMVEVQRVMKGLEASVGNGFYNVPLTLTWPMLKEMQRNGFTIGSHTRHHVSLPTESAEVVADELEGSKRDIEKHLGRTVEHFAYPGGQFTCPVVAAVERAGYRFAYTACSHDDPRHPTLTVNRLLLWEGSSVDADGRFSPDILNVQVHDLWPPARRCGRTHHV